MNLRNLDLNLLIVFDCVARQGGVTRAASSLNMTQSAISHALARLRSVLGNELFVRSAEGMIPTPYAEQLALAVRAVLQDLQVALDGTRFDPLTASRRVTIAVDNRAALVFAAPLALAVARDAPNLTLDLRPSGTLDLVERLDRGDVDLVLGGLASPAERFADILLCRDEFVALVRRGHPAAGASVVTHEDLAASPHLALSSIGEDTDFVDRELARRGLVRRVTLRAPLLATPAILARSDMVAIVGSRIADAFARSAELSILGLPFASPEVSTAMLWHRRLTDLPAHRWLRGAVTEVARSL